MSRAESERRKHSSWRYNQTGGVVNLAAHQGDDYEDERFMENLGRGQGRVRYEEWNSAVEDEFFERERQRALYELNVELTRPCDPQAVYEANLRMQSRTTEPTRLIVLILSDGRPHNLVKEIQEMFPNIDKQTIWNSTGYLVTKKHAERVSKGTYRRIST